MFDEADRGDLLIALSYQRSSVVSIVTGMSEMHWHTSVVPSGWTPAGMVAHLGDAERHWTCRVILDRDPGHRFDGAADEQSERDAWVGTAWPSTKAMTYYRDHMRQTDLMLARTPLDAEPKGHHVGPDTTQARSVREVVLHLIEETAAHSGHLELARELLDGRTGLGLR